MLTLEEAILHAEEVAEEQEKASKELQECKNRGIIGWSTSDIESVDKSIVKCSQCAAEHKQLAEWLKDYKRLLEEEPKTGHWITISSTDMYCSECNEVECLNTSRKFCAYCGTKMVEP